jgi:hypothetical protein
MRPIEITRQKVIAIATLITVVGTAIAIIAGAARMPAQAFVRNEIETNAGIIELHKSDAAQRIQLQQLQSDYVTRRYLDSVNTRVQSTLDRLDERTLWIKDRLK